MIVTAFHEHRCELGESPLWHPDEQALYCVDIARREVLRFQGAALSRWPQPAEPSALALRDDGSLLVARRDGLFTLTGEALAAPPYDAAKQRFNDGKPGPDGAWWLGTIDDARAPEAALYRCTPAGIERRLDGITNSNGLAWSPDGNTMYWADTKAHTVYRLKGDGSGERGVFAQWPARDPAQPLEQYAGRPDGAAVDAEGCYWVAMFEGQHLLRLSPEGRTLLALPLPVRCPTMPCFGGDDLRTLFITTAREKRPAEELAAQPLAGAVLQLRVHTPGLPPRRVHW
jgi:sugar lactone lactonase YvrE